MGGVLRGRLYAAIALALTAAAARLVPLAWLHPLNYDEVELFRATDWVRRGLVPYRDFWQNHTPLQWYVFAPLSGLAAGDGVAPVIVMRWLQVPLWIAVFWLVNRWMRELELPPPARWTALALALSSSWLMMPAVEYRLDVLGAGLFLAGLLRFGVRRRESPLSSPGSGGSAAALQSGALFFLAGFANLRLGPLLAVTVILLALLEKRRALHLFAGVAATAAVTALAFAAMGALDELYRQLWIENYLGDKYVEKQPRQFIARLLIPFGLLLRGTRPTFSLPSVDPGGIALLVLGGAGIVRALRNWRTRDAWLVLALLQLASLAFIARMKVVYNYHFVIVALLMIPFVAAEVARVKWRPVVWAAVVAAWCVNLYASVLRGKEHDRAYQDLIIKEAHRRTLPTETVFSGAALALRREPAYRLWVLVDLTTLLVQHREAAPYGVAELLRDPPAALITDYYAQRYLGIDRAFRRLVVTHYLPVWRNLWVPAPSGRLTSGQELSWTVLRDGDYRVYAAPGLALHPWFDKPVYVGLLDRPDAARFPIRVGAPRVPAGLQLTVDGLPAAGDRLRLRKGQNLTAKWAGEGAVGVLFLPGADEIWFRNPPPGVTLEAAYPRVTHWPEW